MQTLTVYLVQTHIEWENPKANLARLELAISQTNPNSLVVLPEMFSTGFTMNPALHAETMQGESLQWMRALSHDRMICGSLSIQENGKYFNRFFAVSKGEICGQYDKKYLFSFGDEPSHYTAGDRNCIVEYNGWRIAPFICFDLRFPESMRDSMLNTSQDKIPHILLFVANWPISRVGAWDALLIARAIENQAYTLGVNRLGIDGNGIEHNGHSQAIDFSGLYLHEPNQTEAVSKIVLRMEPLLQFRSKFPFLNDARGGSHFCE